LGASVAPGFVNTIRHSEFFLGDEAQDELFGNRSQAL